MASSLTRRPIPALVALVALLLLAALVWWRVLNRSSADDDSDSASTPCPTPTSTAAHLKVLPAPKQVTLTVLNSTNRAGLAGRTRTALLQVGFRIPTPADNDLKKTITGVAEIRYGPGHRNDATVVSYYLPGAKLVPTASKSDVVVISLGAKFQKLASQQAVTAALNKDHVRLGGASSGAPAGNGSSTVAASC